ncbi:MAG: efflux RND transporter periplasmic adaptor subunit [Bacteroidales bacterium]|nr:efflux RND transporter periplasmic adaptor subunit [Bacteroidales bacterium]
MKIARILAAGALAMTTVACGSFGGKKQGAQTEEKVPEVTVTTTSARDVDQFSTYTSSVEAFAVNNIAPQSGGRIQKINVEVGDFVKAGDVLAEMDRVNLVQAELQMRNNGTELERLRGLYDVGGLSKSDLDNAELAYEVSKSSYENLLENAVLRSPIDGVVSARNYDRGDMYGMQAPIYTVQQIVPVKLNIGISEGDYTKVKKGDNVTLTVDAFPGKTFRGRVNRIDPTIDFITHTCNVEIIVQNSDMVLRPGMYARVTVMLETRHSIVIPDTAVIKQSGSGERYVYVLNEDNTVSFRVVELGRRMEAEQEILSGLDEGETVVISGQAAIRDGAQVKVITRASAGVSESVD